jgi:hypothetical protein
MRRLALYLVLTVVATIALDRSLGLFLEHLYDNSMVGQNGGDLNRYLARSRPDILVIGSSRAHHHVIPDSLSSSAYNLSHNGMSVAFQAGLVSVLAQHDAMPKKVLLLHVDPEEFLSDQAGGDIRFLRRYYGSVPYVKDRINELHPLERYAFWSDVHRFNGMVPGLLRTWWKPATPEADPDRGYVQRPDQPMDATRTIHTARKDSINAATYAVRWSEERVRDGIVKPVHHIDSICRARGVTLILFTSPRYRTTPAREAFDARTRSALGASPRWITLQPSELAEIRGIKYWRDNVHLRHDGARLLSGHLAAAISQPDTNRTTTP